jgi:hypothetical protein
MFIIQVTGREITATNFRSGMVTSARDAGIDGNVLSASLFHSLDTQNKHYISGENNALSSKYHLTYCF